MDDPDCTPERASDPGADDQPEVYSADKDRTGWKFSRRDFLTLAAAAAAALAAGNLPGQKARAGPIELVGHSTEPALSELAEGQPFTKIWQFKNSTGKPWGEGALLRLSGAEQFKIAGPVALPNAAPGQVVTVRVPMVAPAQLASPPVAAAFQVADAEYQTFLPIIMRAPASCTCVGDVCTCDGYSCTCVGDACTCDDDFPCTCDYDFPCPTDCPAHQTCPFHPTCPYYNCPTFIPCGCDFYCSCDAFVPCPCDVYWPCSCDYDCGCVGYFPCGCDFYF